jgi:hypothetical protein
MSWGAKPRFSASWGLGGMPIMSWFRRYEFMVLPGGVTETGKKLFLAEERCQESFFGGRKVSILRNE